MPTGAKPGRRPSALPGWSAGGFPLQIDTAALRRRLEAKAAELRDDFIFNIGSEASELTAVALTAARVPILTPRGPTRIEDATWRRIGTAGADAALRAMVDAAVDAVSGLDATEGFA